MKSKIWLAGWLSLVFIILGFLGGWVYRVDPYFHYHKPDIDKYFYILNNERSQNDGISKHFDYDALITGTSMTQNFKVSEVNEIFEVNAVKVSYSGGTYKEINDNLIRALGDNDELKLVIRGLDMGHFFDEASRMREDLGRYPTYLYDSNPFNDVNYLFNREVIFNRIYPMVIRKNKDDLAPGITSFDDYGCWQYAYTFGINTLFPDGIKYPGMAEAIHLEDAGKAIIAENITQNVTSLADEYPDVDFYYFFTPYSIAWWESIAEGGRIYQQIEAEKYIIELILEHENIHLFSFNNRTDIITDLNNYKDAIHYGQWINSLMLRWMHEGQYLLTKDNYQEYINEELSFYTSFNYNTLNSQVDYENDFYAAALLNNELAGVLPINLLEQDTISLNLSGALITEKEKYGDTVLQCTGSLQREFESDQSIESFLIGDSYVGAKIEIESMDEYGYLVFYGKKARGQGQPTVYVYDNQNEKVAELVVDYKDLDQEWHQYVIDLTKVGGKVTIIFNGGYIDKTGGVDSSFLFKDIIIY